MAIFYFDFSNGDIMRFNISNASLIKAVNEDENNFSILKKVVIFEELKIEKKI